MNYEQAIAYLDSYPDFAQGRTSEHGNFMSLGCMKSLLTRLGNPQDGRHTVHITGSKGKGSVSNFIAAILNEAKLSTALFTSPALNNYEEQIAFDLKPVAEEKLAEAVKTISKHVEDEHASLNKPVTTFGILCALFFYLAKANHMDWQVVEVGIGGTNDLTNVFANKDLAIITSISLEHTAILGKTIAEIAENKSGIITKNAKVILAKQADPIVKKIVFKKCETMQAELIDVEAWYKSRLIKQTHNEQIFVVDGFANGREIRLSTLGEYQIDNAVCAIAGAMALKSNGFNISEAAIVNGLAKVKMPGRFEIISQNPIVVLDGAHNNDSAYMLKRALQKQFNDKSFVVVLGANEDKDIEAISKHAVEISKKIVVTKSQNKRAMEIDNIINVLKKKDIVPHIAENIEEAMKVAHQLAKKNDVICVTGSLYLVSEARQMYENCAP